MKNLSAFIEILESLANYSEYQINRTVAYEALQQGKEDIPNFFYGLPKSWM